MEKDREQVERSRRAAGGRKKERIVTPQMRLKAVKLRLEEGLSSKLIRREFGIHKSVLYNWVKRYREGGGTGLAGQIHAISIAQHLFGAGVDSVECMGKDPLTYMRLEYGERKNRPVHGVNLNCLIGTTPHCAFYASAYGPEGVVHSPPIGDFQFPWGAARNLELARQMVHTGKPVVSYDEMIENVAVAEAGRLAHKRRRAVRISEVWRGAKRT